MTFKSISEIITIIAAFLGMGLGIYNLLIERSKRKVKIKVKPRAVTKRFRNSLTGESGVITSPDEFNCTIVDEYFAVEAINLSNFPVVVDNVGFEVQGQKRRMVIVQPILFDNGKWPRKLGQRESVTIYGLLQDILNYPQSSKIKNAFVETSCDGIFRGTSAALTGLVNHIKSIKESA